MQVDAGGCGDPLALLDEPVHEMAEIIGTVLVGEVEVVREPGQRGDAVHRRVEDQLRPLRGEQIRKRLGLQPGRDEQLGNLMRAVERRVAVRPEPGRRVEDVLDVGVGVPRAAHEGDGGDERPVAVGPDDLLGAEPVLDRHHGRARQPALEPRRNGLEVGALRRENRQVGVRQRGRVVGRPHPRSEVVAPAHAQAVLLERPRVLCPPRQHPDLGDLREVGGEEAADRAGARDADALDHAAYLSRRYRRYGSGSRRAPVTRSSVSTGVNFLPSRCRCSPSHSRSAENSPASNCAGRSGRSATIRSQIWTEATLPSA